MIGIFRLSLKDFLTRKFILLSILPFLVAVVLLSGFMIFGGKELFDTLSLGAQSGDFSFLDESEYPWLAKALTFGLTKWIISALFYVAGTFLVLMLSVFIALGVAGFLTPIVAKELNSRHYNLVKESEPSFWRVMKLMGIELVKFIVILLICLPLLFIPVINLFAINIPFFYLYYKFLLVDVASNALDKTKFELAYKKGGGYGFIFACIVFYILCLVPFVGLFFQLFFVIYLTHILYSKERKNSLKY
ncbi:EI24 domain-containing protein [Campylobacter geochelonis]|uniref:EI24 domain-containing protein n=1 Tax=Campylobacter geochelonis TaxID=1780362 RepID=UPI0007709426|nr:EI24 domain-containing protein [Campylobacter geochelonis]CZE49958.1 putative integral membrane protein [Campylobacter geochelonis]